MCEQSRSSNLSSISLAIGESPDKDRSRELFTSIYAPYMLGSAYSNASESRIHLDLTMYDIIMHENAFSKFNFDHLMTT